MKKLLISLSLLLLTSCGFVIDSAFDSVKKNIGLEQRVDHEHDKWNPVSSVTHRCPPIQLQAYNNEDCYYLKKYCKEDKTKEYYRHDIDYCECNNYEKYYKYLLK